MSGRRMVMLLVAVLLWGSLLPGAAGCRERDEDGTRPVSQDLAALELRDDTPDLLITWIDAKGDHHVVQRPQEVPEESREMVRVVTLKNGHGDLFYIADLRNKNADGTYPVKTMARSAWELVAEQRRAKSMAALAPTASGSTGSGGTPTGPLAPPSSQLTAIVYAAAWCSACRSAEAFLRKQGVMVIVKDIERDPGAKAEMDRKVHRAGLPKRGTIPVIDIRGRVLVGFDEREIKRIIRESTRGDML